MKYKIKILILSTIAFWILVSCYKSNTINNQKTLTVDSAKDSDADFAKVDDDLFLNYKQRLDSAKDREKYFINHLISIMTQFRDKKLDSTILTIGLIDNDNIVDTVKTRVYYKNDTIWVNSSWIKDSMIIWHDSFINPYLFISNSDLFQFDTRSIWVTFSIGICYAAPSLIKTNDYKNLYETAINFGLKDLKDNGVDLSKADYNKYLLNFKGDLIEWGDPMDREGLHIWYEPLKRFVTFYQP